MSQIEWLLEFERIRMQIEIPMRTSSDVPELSAADVAPWYDALARYGRSDDLPPSGELVTVINGSISAIVTYARFSSTPRALLDIADSMGHELQALFDPFYPGTAFEQVLPQSWWPIPGRLTVSLIGASGFSGTLDNPVLLSRAGHGKDWTALFALDWLAEFSLDGRQYLSVEEFLGEPGAKCTGRRTPFE